MTIEEATQILNATDRGQAVGFILRRLFQIDIVRLTEEERAAVIVLIWDGMQTQPYAVAWALKDF